MGTTLGHNIKKLIIIINLLIRMMTEPELANESTGQVDGNNLFIYLSKPIYLYLSI